MARGLRLRRQPQHQPSLRQHPRHEHLDQRRRSALLDRDSSTGKSHLLIGLGTAAAQQGFRVRYTLATKLVNELVQAADEKQLAKTIARYGRVDLPCIDELGYMGLDRRGAELLFQVLTEREETNSIAIASNQPFFGWTRTFTDPSALRGDHRPLDVRREHPRNRQHLLPPGARVLRDVLTVSPRWSIQSRSRGRTLVVMPDDRLALRTRFNEDALLYDRARPTYPAAVFDAIFDRLPDPARAQPRILEIGCGTGQATRPLAQRGSEVLAVDLGADMAEVARRNLATFGNVTVINADIEQWDPAETQVDLVVSATAFHWLNPATRFARVARLLRPGGVLALIQTIHIEGRSENFFADAQRCYERWDPTTPPGLRRPRLQDLPDSSEYGIEHAEEFEQTTLQRFAVDFRYTAEQYLDLLMTFSNHRALPAADLKGLLVCLRKRIEAEPDHSITKSVAFELSSALAR